jgi:hypothetical protein
MPLRRAVPTTVPEPFVKLMDPSRMPGACGENVYDTVQLCPVVYVALVVQLPPATNVKSEVAAPVVTPVAVTYCPPAGKVAVAVSPVVLEPTAVAGAVCADATTAAQKKKLNTFSSLLDGGKQFANIGKNFAVIMASIALGVIGTSEQLATFRRVGYKLGN